MCMVGNNKLDADILQSKIEQKNQSFETENIPEKETQAETEKVYDKVLPKKSKQSSVSTVKLPSLQKEEVLTPEDEQEVEEVEHILEEDLGDIYKELDPQSQKTFKEQGEVTAKTIVMLLHKVKIRTRLIMKTISKWLFIIPGVNRNFVEQESKIKTDRIVDMHEHEHEHKNKK